MLQKMYLLIHPCLHQLPRLISCGCLSLHMLMLHSVDLLIPGMHCCRAQSMELTSRAALPMGMRSKRMRPAGRMQPKPATPCCSFWQKPADLYRTPAASALTSSTSRQLLGRTQRVGSLCCYPACTASIWSASAGGD